MSVANIGPVIDLAVERVHQLVKEGHYNNFTIEVHHHVTRCFISLKASAMAADIYHNPDDYGGRVAAFVGPHCGGLMRGVAELCGVWGVPVMSALTASILPSEKRFFNTLTRTTTIFIQRLWSRRRNASRTLWMEDGCLVMGR